jgi:hypothetical protein
MLLGDFLESTDAEHFLPDHFPKGSQERFPRMKCDE